MAFLVFTIISTFLGQALKKINGRHLMLIELIRLYNLTAVIN